ncbi:response regulator [Cytobacillus gottheilii]|nr:response regulator [Cytobacillus gottheilii]
MMHYKVLIADDSMFMRQLLKKAISSDRYTVIGEAANGKEAIKLFKRMSPDIVLLDLTMDGINGMTALKEIRRIDSRANVIICSAMGQSKIIIEALQNGAKDFVVKPFFNELLPALDKVIK